LEWSTKKIGGERERERFAVITEVETNYHSVDS